MVLQWPALRIIADSERVKSSFDRVPARTSSLSFHTPVPQPSGAPRKLPLSIGPPGTTTAGMSTLAAAIRSEEHTSELQSRGQLVCRLLLEKKNSRAPHPL